MEEQQLIQEVTYKAVRSSGAGGQNVNKVSSKVELHFFIEPSEALSEEEKALLLVKLQPRLTKNNELILQSDESRSQPDRGRPRARGAGHPALSGDPPGRSGEAEDQEEEQTFQSLKTETASGEEDPFRKEERP